MGFLGISLGGAWIGYLIAGFIGACILIAVARAFSGAFQRTWRSESFAREALINAAMRSFAVKAASQSDGRERMTPDATTHFPPQHDELMSERSVFCLKSSPRLKRRGEQGQAEAEQSDHGRWG
jgi:hypothetical protein